MQKTIKLAKNGNFIYNILSKMYTWRYKMFNPYNNKTKKIVSAVIVIILVLAMVIPTIASFL